MKVDRCFWIHIYCCFEIMDDFSDLNSTEPMMSLILLHNSPKQLWEIQKYRLNWISVFVQAPPNFFLVEYPWLAARIYLYLFLIWAKKSWRKMSNISSSILLFVSKRWRRAVQNTTRFVFWVITCLSTTWQIVIVQDQDKLIWFVEWMKIKTSVVLPLVLHRKAVLQ